MLIAIETHRKKRMKEVGAREREGGREKEGKKREREGDRVDGLKKKVP